MQFGKATGYTPTRRGNLYQLARSNSLMSTVAFFDLDYTLLDTSSGMLYIREALRQRRVPWWVIGHTFLGYQLKRLDFGQAHGRLITYVGRPGQRETANFFAEWVPRRLLPRLTAAGQAGGLEINSAQWGNGTRGETTSPPYRADLSRPFVAVADFQPIPARILKEHRIVAGPFGIVRSFDVPRSRFEDQSGEPVHFIDAVGPEGDPAFVRDMSW